MKPIAANSAAALLAASLSAQAVAQTAPAGAPSAAAPAAEAAPAAAPAAPPAFQIYGINLNAQLDAGVTFNPDSPSNGVNFGHLFTDRANRLVMNQLLLTAQKPIDPKSPVPNFGFDVQLLYGTDARYTHFVGELNYLTTSRYQLDLLNANIQAHLPYLVPGGIDLKIGQYPTPLGFETIDPSTNPFYSHSYIFNFGLPFKHTGGYAVAHVSDVLDVYLGGDSGVNTAIGNGDNNSAPAFLGGVNLTLLGGKLTVLALTHIGPENPSRTVPGADGFMRYYNDVVATYRATDKLSLTTELNWVRDAFARANGLGAAQYVSYALTETLTLNGRAEVWRDDNGFYVAAFPGPLDAVNALAGKPANVITFGRNTYGELTAGVTYKPAVPAPVATLMLRPEIRWDHAFGSTTPFNGGRDRNAVTIAGDVVLGF